VALPNHWPIQTLVTLTAKFTALDTGQPIDPSVVTLRVLSPNGTPIEYSYLTDPQLVRDDVGQYHANVVTSQSGLWLYKWQGSGTILVTSADRRFFVDPSELISG
jgi:hypothetical protein